MSLNTKTGSPEEQYQILSQGVVDLINKEELLNKLKQNRPLKVKAGFDPSRPDIHLGHAILINKLREFQELGHEVFFVVGDFTACVGDPSGQNKTRPVLSFKEAKQNAKSYVEQVTSPNLPIEKELSPEAKSLPSFFKRLDPKKTKCVFNSEWLDKIPLRDFIISISSRFTLAQQLERNDFSLRYKSGKPIGLHELFYPILQACDSMQLKADVEIGGTDQLFNLLLGRDLQEQFRKKQDGEIVGKLLLGHDLQEQFGQTPQVIFTLPLLEGLDGSKKMSKSLDNAISFKDSPEEIYGKVMKISDELLIRWWNIFTKGKCDLKKVIQKKNLNPKIKKEELAWIFISSLHGEEKADQAQKNFLKRHVENKLPDPEFGEMDLDWFSEPAPDPDEEVYTAEKQAWDDFLKSESKEDREKREQANSELIKKANKYQQQALSEFLKKASKVKNGLIEKNKVKGTVQPQTQDLREIGICELIKRAGLSSSNSEARRAILSNAIRKGHKWEWIHDLKVYLVYRKVKEGLGEKDRLCEDLAKDEDFKEAKISSKSIKMKFENNRYLDTGKGLEHCSKQNKQVFNKYKDCSIKEITTDIENEARRVGLSNARIGHEEEQQMEWERLKDPTEKVDLSKDKEFVLAFGKRKFRRINLKWERIHELKVLKAYFVYRKVKEDKDKLCKDLAEDKDFKEAKISLGSIKMKFENNRYLDTKGKEGLKNCSVQNKEIFDAYEKYSIKEIEKEIDKENLNPSN